MTCIGHCNDCAAHAGYVPGITPTSWTDDPLARGILIKEEHWDELRDAIDAETTRRSTTWATGDGDPGNVAVGDKVYQGGTGLPDGWRELRNQVSYLDTGSGSGWQPASVDNTTILTGEPILDDSPQAIRDRLNVIEAECYCDCNYACTCNCNYCVCNCNYCVCNCNYPCTCNCNYSAKSDRRLKKEIKYL